MKENKEKEDYSIFTTLIKEDTILLLL